MVGKLFYFVVLLTLTSACPKADPTSSIEKPEVSLNLVLSTLDYHPDDVGIAVSKKRYLMGFMIKDSIVKTYPVVFGGNPIDDKRMQGDKCTPEGWFGIRAKYPHKKWNKFIWIDYPNAESWSKHNASKRSGQIPDSATIGGEIGIHGVPPGKDWWIDEKMNWTLGCIAMKNKHIDEVFPHLNENTQVYILK